VVADQIARNAGNPLPVNEFSERVVETQVRHSTTLDGGRHLTGPGDGAGLGEQCRNPFRSIVVRAVETTSG
jgi:sulfhydrogenase subunit alpha